MGFTKEATCLKEVGKCLIEVRLLVSLVLDEQLPGGSCRGQPWSSNSPQTETQTILCDGYRNDDDDDGRIG